MLVVAVLLGVPQLATVASVLVGGGYAASLAIGGGNVDLAAPLVGAGLVLSCELCFWSHDLHATSPDEPGLRSLHTVWLSLLALGTLAAGTALVTLVDVARLDGLAIEALGAAAALGVAALLLVTARRT